MRELLLWLGHGVLLALMTICLPFFWLVSQVAKLLRAGLDALEVQLVLARARRKVLSAVKRRNAR